MNYNTRQVTKEVSFLAIFTLCVVIATIFTVNRCTTHSDIASATHIADNNKLDLKQAREWRDKYNRIHFELERTQVDKAVLQVYSDSIADLLNIKSKQIQQLTQIKVGVDVNKPLDVTHLRDTLYITKDSILIVEHTKFSYLDKWIELMSQSTIKEPLERRGVDRNLS